MTVKAAVPGSKCTYEVFVDRSSSTAPCGLPAVSNVNGQPRCTAHTPNDKSSKKAQMPKQGRGASLGETTDRAALS